MINTHLQSAFLEQEFHIHHKERFRPNQTKPNQQKGLKVEETSWEQVEQEANRIARQKTHDKWAPMPSV
jgi:hypothetical protein